MQNTVYYTKSMESLQEITSGQTQDVQSILNGSNSKKGKKGKSTSTPEKENILDIQENLNHNGTEVKSTEVQGTQTQTQGKKKKKMTPTTEKIQDAKTKRVQRTVFDLQAFDDVKLVKEVELPKKPESLDEALAAVGNNKEILLNVIYEGLIADATEKAWEDINGFHTLTEEGEIGEEYSGKFADEEKGKLINAAILSLAKMQGYDKSLSKEKKRELKEKATEFLRSNPAMLQSIQG